MEFVRKAVLWVVGALFWSKPANAAYGWLGRHKLPVAVFGSLLAVILAVAAYAGAQGRTELVKHIFDREFVVHFGVGTWAYMLLQRTLLVIERKRSKRLENRNRLPWAVWYFVPMAALLTVNSINEWGFAMTPIPEYCIEGNLGCGYWGGDWARAALKPEGSLALKLKSIADIAAWSFAALAAAWWMYFSAERQWFARMDYLKWKGKA